MKITSVCFAVLLLGGCKTAQCPHGERPVNGLCDLSTDGGSDATLDAAPDATTDCSREGQPCGLDAGLCESGTFVCVAGEDVCMDALGPSDEACNGADDDCDGIIDEAQATLSSAIDYADPPQNTQRSFIAVRDGYASVVRPTSGQASGSVQRVGHDGQPTSVAFDVGDNAAAVAVDADNRLVVVRTVVQSATVTRLEAAEVDFVDLPPGPGDWHTLSTASGIDFMPPVILVNHLHHTGTGGFLLSFSVLSDVDPGLKFLYATSPSGSPTQTSGSTVEILSTDPQATGPIIYASEFATPAVAGHILRGSLQRTGEVTVSSNHVGRARLVDLGGGEAALASEEGNDLYRRIFDVDTLRCVGGGLLSDCAQLWVTSASIHDIVHDGGRIIALFQKDGILRLRVMDEAWGLLDEIPLPAGESGSEFSLAVGSDHGIVVNTAASDTLSKVRIYGCVN